jgi:hypothetical protein
MKTCIRGTATARLLPRTAMFQRFTFSLFVALLTFFALNLGNRSFGSDSTDSYPPRPRRVRNLLSSHHSAQESSATDLAVHEWGTFTSVAGSDGQAMDWLPLTGSTDLPAFVEHYRDTQFKGGLRGTIRMETPVLYFYSPRETAVSVHVSFPKGLITEWYPRADSVNPNNTVRDYSLYQMKSPGEISWNSVRIHPEGSTEFPADNPGNHYFAARQTSSAPLTVDTPSGPQHEKFLFYRGVSAQQVPFAANVLTDGSVQVRNNIAEEIPMLIFFERRGERIGYRVLSGYGDQASFARLDLSASLDSLSRDLEGILVSEGLFPEEARAMLETWKNSWFEEGSRLIYIVAPGFVDSVLPLRITPAPTTIVRVFVGRLELITPATEQAVESAFAFNDQATLSKYSRFLEPILSTMIQKSTDPARSQRLVDYLNAVYGRLYVQAQD